MKMTLEGSFSRTQTLDYGWDPRVAGCGKPDGSLSVPCRATVLQGLVCRPFLASGWWHGCWSAANCVWMVCVPKCRLIAVGLPESELTRCQQVLVSGAGGGFLREPFCVRRCRGSLLPFLWAADGGSLSCVLTAWRPRSPSGRCQCLPSSPPRCPRHSPARLGRSDSCSTRLLSWLQAWVAIA